MYKFIRFLMLAFYKIFYRVEYINKNNIIPEGKCIITCNHLGKADVMIVGALYKDKTYFLAKKECGARIFLSNAGSGMVECCQRRKTALVVLYTGRRGGNFPRNHTYTKRKWL
jgi:hypothetical protein